MDFDKLSKIVPIIGVIVMFLWGVLGNDWGHSWIAVVIGGLLAGIFRVMANKKDE